MWFIYILLCEDLSLYTGMTNDLDKRFLAHKNGKGGNYTRSHKAKKMIHKEEFATKSEALKREIEIKTWTRVKKISTFNLQLDLNK